MSDKFETKKGQFTLKNKNGEVLITPKTDKGKNKERKY